MGGRQSTFNDKARRSFTLKEDVVLTVKHDLQNQRKSPRKSYNVFGLNCKITENRGVNVETKRRMESPTTKMTGQLLRARLTIKHDLKNRRRYPAKNALICFDGIAKLQKQIVALT